MLLLVRRCVFLIVLLSRCRSVPGGGARGVRCVAPCDDACGAIDLWSAITCPRVRVRSNPGCDSQEVLRWAWSRRGCPGGSWMVALIPEASEEVVGRSRRRGESSDPAPGLPPRGCTPTPPPPTLVEPSVGNSCSTPAVLERCVGLVPFRTRHVRDSGSNSQSQNRDSNVQHTINQE